MRGREAKRDERRGSALVVVIGALALIAVFAALYVTIGQGDQRIAKAVTDARDVAEVDRVFARRILSIVAEDRLAAYPEAYIDPNEPGYAAGGRPNAQRFVREGTDYPYTDYSVRSVFPLPNPSLDVWTPAWARNAGAADEARAILGFDAVGNASVPWTDAPGSPDIREDRRVASDPWLASTEPSFIGWRNVPVNPGAPIDGGIDNDGRAYSLFRPNRGPYSHPALRYLDARDWKQITNIAPDGLFVNLFNLRGNFDAEPGIGLSGGEHRMTSRLTLLEPFRMFRDSPLRATTNLPFGLGDMASTAGEVDAQYLNIPAIWSSNQRFMFFPLNQPEAFAVGKIGARSYNSTNGIAPAEIAGWADFEFPDYQYADADGDGMADSRWFELTDASDPDNVVFELPVGEYRFFAAARIIDLSALVNVNSATDGLRPPTNWAPPGMTPADVDLRRLLRMTDQARGSRQFPRQAPDPDAIDGAFAYSSSVSTLGGFQPVVDGLSYRHIEHPVGYHDDEGREWGSQNYLSYVEKIDPSLPDATPLRVSSLLGGFGYDALRRSIQNNATGITLGSQNNNFAGTVVPPTSPLASLVDASPFEYGGLYPGFTATVPYNSLSGVQPGQVGPGAYYGAVGSLDAARATAEPETAIASGLFGSRLFGTDDLGELLAYRGINDDTLYSRLEETLGGRYSIPGVAATSNVTTLRFSPLRSNRSTALERLTHDNVRGYPQEINAQSFGQIEADGVVDQETMAMFALSPRARLTTVSGASPIRSSVIYEDISGGVGSPNYRRWDGGSGTLPPLIPLGAGATIDNTRPGNSVDGGAVDLRSATLKSGRIDLRLLIDDMLETSAAPSPNKDPRFIRRRAVDTLFKVYADALLPDSDIEDGLAWEDTGGEHLWTLFYGHKGPEAALLAAAHLTANMKDLVDDDNVPTGMTLVVQGGERGSDSGSSWAYRGQGGNAPTPTSASDRDFGFQWGQADGGQTEVADGYILDLDRGNPNRFVAPSVSPDETKLHPDLTGGSQAEAARRAVTVFGIEAHPIITEVASIMIYADAQDLGDAGDAVTEATIEATYTPGASQNDTAIQVLAFQLHNPFDVSVPLSSWFAAGNINASDAQLEAWDYAIEYNGHYFPVVDFFWDGAAYRFRDAGSLGPGRSRVFYAINEPDFGAIETRWDAIVGAFGRSINYNGSAEDSIRQFFFNQQFGQVAGAAGPPMFLQRVDAATGLRDATERDIFAAGTTSLRTPNNDEVRLWRVWRDPSNTAEPEETTTDVYWPENDILVDRLRDPFPTEDSWDVALDNDIDIDMDLDNNGAADKDFVPFSVTRWATVRRPDHVDEDGVLDEPARGAVPAYMLESVQGSAGAYTNIRHRVLPDSGDLNDREDFEYLDATPPGSVNADAYAAFSLFGVFEAIGFTDDDGNPVPQGAGALVSSIIRPPYDKGTAIRENHLADRQDVVSAAPFPNTDESPSTTVDPTGGSNPDIFLSEIQPELYTGPGTGQRGDFKRVIGSIPNEVEISTLRVTDILRPLAIGPMHVPANNPGFNSSDASITLDVGDGEWLTLGEALSIALGFEDPLYYNAGRQPGPGPTAGAIIPGTYSPLQDAVQTQTGASGTTAPVRMFDRGQIRLDAFVPFVNFANFNTGGELARDVPLYQPEFGDYRIGGGATPAARLLGSLRAITPNVGEIDPSTGSPFDANELATPVVGTVNINTAPLSVLRLLPGLSPSLEVDSRGNDESWMRNPQWNSGALSGTQRSDLGLPDPRDPTLLGAHSQASPNPELWLQRPDIAATIAAYRDRTIADIRFDSREPFAGDNRIDDLTFAPMLFANAADNTFPRFGMLARNFEADFGAAGGGWNVNVTADRGRYMLNGQQGVRELPGFGSMGELLGASMAPDDPITRPGMSINGGFMQFGQLGFFDLDPATVTTGTTRWLGDGTALGAGRPSIDDMTAPNLFGPHDMFALARDEETFGTVDTGSGSVTLTNEAYLRGTNNQADEIPDDYDEQLAALAGIMNVADVRSDYFAAWYVIRGYRQSDVEGLSEDAPMLPSFQKRYLLVIDRSNVIEAGDRPRVVLFRELPL